MITETIYSFFLTYQAFIEVEVGMMTVCLSSLINFFPDLCYGRRISSRINAGRVGTGEATDPPYTAGFWRRHSGFHPGNSGILGGVAAFLKLLASMYYLFGFRVVVVFFFLAILRFATFIILPVIQI